LTQIPLDQIERIEIVRVRECPVRRQRCGEGDQYHHQEPEKAFSAQPHCLGSYHFNKENGSVGGNGDLWEPFSLGSMPLKDIATMLVQGKGYWRKDNLPMPMKILLSA